MTENDEIFRPVHVDQDSVCSVIPGLHTYTVCSKSCFLLPCTNVRICNHVQLQRSKHHWQKAKKCAAQLPVTTPSPAGQGCLQAKPWKGHETTAELSKAVGVLAVTGIRLAVPHVAPGGASL